MIEVWGEHEVIGTHPVGFAGALTTGEVLADGTLVITEPDGARHEYEHLKWTAYGQDIPCAWRTYDSNCPNCHPGPRPAGG